MRDCVHVTDEELRAFYGRHPRLLCARCWLQTQRELGTLGLALKKMGKGDS
jgi:hypothetical protein